MRCARSTRDVVLAAIASLIVGCAPAPGPPRPPPSHPPDRAGCPLGIDGARVSTEETETGIAVIVTARDDDVAEIRERAQDAAKLHGPFGRLGKGHDGRHGRGGQHGLQAVALPPSRATTTDVAGGARIEISPRHWRDRAALRELVRKRAEVMRTKPCDVDDERRVFR